MDDLFEIMSEDLLSGIHITVTSASMLYNINTELQFPA